MRASHRTLVLLPYGLPKDPVERDHCVEVVLGCGGDLDRLIDAPAGDVERFARHVARIPVLRDPSPQEVPLVVITRTTPLPLAPLAARRALEAELPSLLRSPWLLYVSLSEDPFFPRAASEVGVLSGDLSLLPVWVAQKIPFLVASTFAKDLSVLPTRLEQLRTYAEKLARRTTAPGLGKA